MQKLARGAARDEITDPAGWLVRVATRLSIDRLRADKAQREAYRGPWLPEPLIEDVAVDPVERAEDVSVAFLLALGRLSPLERAVFLLHEAFDADYAQIAQTLGRSNCGIGPAWPAATIIDQSGFRPLMMRSRTTITAMTSRMWINPLIVYEVTIPNSQSRTKTTAIVYNITGILSFTCLGHSISCWPRGQTRNQDSIDASRARFCNESRIPQCYKIDTLWCAVE